jgi:hypothetical protein
MTLLEKYIEDPQISVAANDDFKVEPSRCFQISEFESDNRIDDHTRNIKLVSNGGGNGGESYDLVLFAAAYLTETDCFQKRGKKGYLFLYADENFFPVLSAKQVKSVFGITVEDNIHIKDLVTAAQEKWEVFVMWPAASAYEGAREQYVELFGAEYVITLEHPNIIAEVIGATIGINEGKVSAQQAIDDLVTHTGISANQASSVATALAPLGEMKTMGKYDGAQMEVGGRGAHRL